QEIYKDRQKFSDQVFRVASSDLVNMGISVVSYTLKDVHDEGDTWAHLGHTWDKTEMHSGYTWDTPGDAQGQDGATWATCGGIRHTWDALGGWGDTAQRDFQVAQAECDGAVSARRATAELAFQLQAARSQQAIAAQRGEVALVERAQRVQLQEQEVGRRRQELEATVRKPAEAERYRLERLAEAQR
ncbi:FLOT1 protein, partial [Irena cyanogastra]|nr:FLOT1 protein [Irena cyanogastra]